MRRIIYREMLRDISLQLANFLVSFLNTLLILIQVEKQANARLALYSDLCERCSLHDLTNQGYKLPVVCFKHRNPFKLLTNLSNAGQGFYLYVRVLISLQQVDKDIDQGR